MSKNNAEQLLSHVGVSALASFFVNFKSSQQKIERSILNLELYPDDNITLLALQKDIAYIQLSLHDVELEKMQPLTVSLIGLLQHVRDGEIEFESLLSDLILLAIEDIKLVIEKIIDGADRCVLVDRLPRICESIAAIATTDELSRLSIIKDALLLLDPSIEIIETSITPRDTLKNLFVEYAPDEEELAAYGVEESDDFVFFRALSEPLESRALYWQGRVHRMLRLALKMNDQAGRPVDPNQLAAAVYMHDAGMALLPLDIINCKDSYSNAERELVQQHPVTGYELMRYMKSWREAAIIVLQHHEHVDGNGYPYGLSEREISDGAKILAIVDAVDARTHERAHVTLLKRPMLRAAIELGQTSGTQFSEKWVNVFKDVFQQVRKMHA